MAGAGPRSSGTLQQVRWSLENISHSPCPHPTVPYTWRKTCEISSLTSDSCTSCFKTFGHETTPDSDIPVLAHLGKKQHPLWAEKVRRFTPCPKLWQLLADGVAPARHLPSPGLRVLTFQTTDGCGCPLTLGIPSGSQEL